MHRTKTSPKKQNPESNTQLYNDYRKEKSKKGLRKRIEVVISRLRHENFRTKLKKCAQIYLGVSIILSTIIAAMENYVQAEPDKKTRRIPHNMVQILRKEDYSRIQFLQQIKVDVGTLKHYHGDQHAQKMGHEKFEDGNCKAMHRWQLDSFPTCNILHETDMSNLFHIAQGSYRDVWVMEEVDGTRFSVKTLVYKRTFTYREYDRHRRDAISMSLLTSSNHIPNIYGYCTNSGLFDYSPGGSLEDHIEIQEKEKQPRWSKQQELRFSWQAAAGLADVHGVGMVKDSPSISHTDMNINQYLWLDGMYKLNDFNRARFIRWDIEKNKPCDFYIGASPGRYRSPEEYNSDHYTEKIDVYSLGNVIYAILTKHAPFYKMKQRKAMELVKNGKRPPIPDGLQETEDKAMIDAIKMCWVQNEKERSSARDVEIFLRVKLQELNVTMH